MQKCKSQFHLHLRTRCIFHYLLSKALLIESTCNAGDPVSISGSERAPEEGIGCLLQYSWASLVVQESTCNSGDLGSVPGLGRSPGGGHGNPFQYSCLENPQGQRSLVGSSPWGYKELDTTERLSMYT